MKKFICMVLVLVLACVLLAGCNETIIDTTYHFDYAYVKLPDGTCVQGTVKRWKDWSDSDTIQITFADGGTYYSHSSNVVLIAGN